MLPHIRQTASPCHANGVTPRGVVYRDKVIIVNVEIQNICEKGVGMDVQLINEELLTELHEKAASNERLRQNFDLRTTPEDGSQRMLNALEVGTHVPIHRHLKTSETVICLEGCLDWVFYEELDSGGPTHDGEVATDESRFVETARFRVCPRDGQYGIQVPLGAWHSVVVHDPSTILESKDGAYGK